VLIIKLNTVTTTRLGQRDMGYCQSEYELHVDSFAELGMDWMDPSMDWIGLDWVG